MNDEEADNEVDQTYWYVCAYCDEGYYSLDEQDITLHPVCDRCWKEAHE